MGVPEKADLKRNVRPCAAEVTQRKMSGIVFVGVRCETLKAIPLMLGGNDSD